MREEFEVINLNLYINSNCIVVDNNLTQNKVINIGYKSHDVCNFKTIESIGVWKIKQLKN